MVQNMELYRRLHVYAAGRFSKAVELEENNMLNYGDGREADARFKVATQVAMVSATIPVPLHGPPHPHE